MMLSSLSSKAASAAKSSALKGSMTSRCMASVPSWATYDPKDLGSSETPYAVSNLVDGEWTQAKSSIEIPHPLDRDSLPIFTTPDTQLSELQPFIDSLRKVSKSGKHNPLKNNDRYVQYGEISRLVSTGGTMQIEHYIMIYAPF